MTTGQKLIRKAFATMMWSKRGIIKVAEWEVVSECMTAMQEISTSNGDTGHSRYVPPGVRRNR